MFEQVIGTCSICGGNIVQENIVYTTIPPQYPPMRCEKCGASKPDPRNEPQPLPKIDMGNT